jgi:ankyrin repeat protein
MTSDIFNAISANDKTTVASLLASNPELAHARNDAGVSALMMAIYQGRTEIADLLRKAAGDLDLYEAAAVGDVPRLHTLLAQDATLVNSSSSDGFTPLHLACFFRQLEAAQILLAAGADANAVSPNRIAIIHSAAASRDASIVKLVLAAGAEPNVQQQGGFTPLQSAAAHNNVEMVQALLDAGADRSVKNDDGMTAADLAMKNGAKEAAELLARASRQAANG